MGEHHKINTDDFSDYLQSAVRLDAMEVLTQELDRQLADSQRVMAQIKSMYESIPIVQNMRQKPATLRHEEVSKFLEADVPKLLLPDMPEDTMEVDVDTVISTMKAYTEELKQNFVLIEVQPKPKEFVKLDLEQYAASLDQLGKRLANMKLTNKPDNNINYELESKLSGLCEDVNMFANMVQAKTTISECNQSLPDSRPESNAMQYNAIITKLLTSINEVTYLLQNKH